MPDYCTSQGATGSINNVEGKVLSRRRLASYQWCYKLLRASSSYQLEAGCCQAGGVQLVLVDRLATKVPMVAAYALGFGKQDTG